MSIIRVLTDQGVKRVKIAGDRPTPEEEQLIRAEYQSVPPMNEMGGTQTMPMTPTLPQEPPQPPPPPELKPDPLTPDQREIVKAKAMQYEQSLQGPGMGTVATKLARPRFAGERPSQGEAAGGKAMGRTIAGTQAFVQGMVGDEERAKQIDQNLASIPYEPGVAGMAEGIMQFLNIASPVSKLGKLRGAGRFTREVAAGAVSGTVGFSGQQERLSDLLKDHPQLANSVTDFLASDPDDSFAFGRFKSGLETAGLDAAVVGAFEVALKSMKGAARLLPGGETKLADEVAESVPKADPNHVVRPPINGQVQTAHAGQIQIPDKAVEAFGKVMGTVLKGGNFAMQKSGVLSDKAIRPISSIIEEKSPRMLNKLYEFEIDQNMLTGEYMNRAVPFMESFRKMNAADKKLLTKHALNSEMPEAYKIIGKYSGKLPGARREFDELIKTFDDLHKLANDNGIEVPYRKNYLPRIMKDYEGYRKHIGVDADSEIKKVIKQAYLDKNKVPQGGALPNNPKALTQFEEREAIRKYLEGTKYTGDGSPGFVKNRKIDKIDDDILPFYGGLEENIQNYINNVTYRVAKNRFTGKVEGVEGYTELLSKLNQSGKVADDDALKINELIEARLSGGEKSIGESAKFYRDGMYLASIGNPISTITQASEFFLNAYRNGTLNTLTTAPKTFARTGIKIGDLGLDDIAKEFSDPLSQSQVGKLGKANKATNYLLRKTLGLVQFKKMDELMKESNLNGAFLEARKKVANIKSKEYQDFAKEMAQYYGPETKKFLDALKRGDANDPNVKTYLFSRLAKTQPISLSEYSEFYLQNPGFRPAYFLKSFALKQLETTRRDVLRKIASGNKDEIREGMRQGIRLSVLFGGGMTANNLFKDYLLDRDDKPGMGFEVNLSDPSIKTTSNQVPKMDNIAGSVADAILTLFGLSRYTAKRLENEPYYGSIDIFMPPKVSELIELGKSSLDGDFNKAGRVIEKNIPIGGKIYSQHFGSAADYKRKKRIEERNKKLRKRGLPPRTRPKRPTRP